MPRPKTRTLKLKIADIDREALPPGARTPGSPAFRDEVSRLVRGSLRDLGGSVDSLAWTTQEFTVAWQPPSDAPWSIQPLLKMLEGGKHHEASLILELLLSDDPDNTDLLYNLGMACSDRGRLDRAVTLLRRLVAVDAGHVNGRVALGVALTRQAKFAEAESELRQAVADAPDNPWAHRNLGACLLNQDRAGEAVPHLRTATELSPSDGRAWYGLGQALEKSGDLAGADAAYRRVVEIGEVGETAERAKQALAKMAGETFRGAAPGMPRMDAVMYCLGALQKFERMAPADVQKVGYEIALLGMSGIDVNDPGKQYTLRSLAGEFTGLHLVCMEYVAFKQVAPEMDIGFDLVREYEMALTLYEARRSSTG